MKSHLHPSEHDPRKQHPGPGFPRQEQPAPGYQEPMYPAPDCGEQSYVGLGRLEGKVALITATKGAIVNLTRSMAKEFAEKGIRVNAVAPGPVWTPLIPQSLSPDHIEHFGENTLLGRAAQPVELAPTYVFLASNESSYIIGEVIAVTGGRRTA